MYLQVELEVAQLQIPWTGLYSHCRMVQLTFYWCLVHVPSHILAVTLFSELMIWPLIRFNENKSILPLAWLLSLPTASLIVPSSSDWRFDLKISILNSRDVCCFLGFVLLLNPWIPNAHVFDYIGQRFHIHFFFLFGTFWIVTCQITWIAALF